MGEDFQEYGRAIPNTMLTDEIRQSKTYYNVLSMSINLIPLKKTRVKGSKGKKQAITPQKKSLIYANDNIIPKLDVVLDLGKSISIIEAEEEEATRDTPRASKKKSMDPSEKLKGVQVVTEEERLVADTMKALKDSRRTQRIQPHTRGSSEGVGII
ncbi:hypothetical protein Tco_0224609 [Tanacetum coccineum]